MVTKKSKDSSHKTMHKPVIGSDKPDKPNPLAKLKNYAELKKDYDLTDDIITFRALMARIGETIENYLKTLSQLLQPEEFYSLHECNAFDEKDKEQILDLYKSLILMHRELMKTEIINVDAKSMAAINDVHSQLKKLRPDMVHIISKMQDSWKEAYKNSTARYFG